MGTCTVHIFPMFDLSSTSGLLILSVWKLPWIENDRNREKSTEPVANHQETDLVFSGTAFSAAPPGDEVEESWQCGHHHCRVFGYNRKKNLTLYLKGPIGKIEVLIGQVGWGGRITLSKKPVYPSPLQRVRCF